MISVTATRFLFTTLPALGYHGACLFLAPGFPETNKAPMKNTITHDRHGFILNGKRTFLLNGTIPYYRLHAGDWAHHLDMLKASG